jgi:hypothetical protein
MLCKDSRSKICWMLLSRDASLNEGSASGFERIAGEVVVGQEEMKRTCPLQSSNHAKGRKISKREISNLQTHLARCAGTRAPGRWDSSAGLQLHTRQT